MLEMLSWRSFVAVCPSPLFLRGSGNTVRASLRKRRSRGSSYTKAPFTMLSTCIRIAFCPPNVYPPRSKKGVTTSSNRTPGFFFIHSYIRTPIGWVLDLAVRMAMICPRSASVGSRAVLTKGAGSSCDGTRPGAPAAASPICLITHINCPDSTRDVRL